MLLAQGKTGYWQKNAMLERVRTKVELEKRGSESSRSDGWLRCGWRVITDQSVAEKAREAGEAWVMKDHCRAEGPQSQDGADRLTWRKKGRSWFPPEVDKSVVLSGLLRKGSLQHGPIGWLWLSHLVAMSSCSRFVFGSGVELQSVVEDLSCC